MFQDIQEKPDKLGELLVAAGIVPSSDIVEALQVSNKLRLPLGRVLLAAEVITNHLLDAVLQAQKMVRQGLSSQTASSALALVANEKISFLEARNQAATLEPVKAESTGNIFD